MGQSVRDNWLALFYPLTISQRIITNIRIYVYKEMIEMTIHGMVVQQRGQLYSIFTPNGIMVAQVYMGNDGLYLGDSRCLDYICKVMAKRWNVK